MKTDSQRASILEALEKAEKSIEVYSRREIGPGFLKLFRRLIRFRFPYLLYLASRFHIRFGATDTTAKTFWGRSIHIPSVGTDFLELQAFGLLGGEEGKLAKFFVKNLTEGDVFYDVGANIGFYGLLARELIGEGEIHAFEPSPHTYPYLEKNMAGSRKQVYLNNLALAQKPGRIPFYDLFGGHHSGKSTTVAGVAHESSSFYEEKEVRALSLDEYCQSHRAPTFLKVDVEGAENDVIAGGTGVLQSCTPVVSIEIWADSRKNGGQLEAARKLTYLGYTAHRITRNGDLEALDRINPEKDISALYGFDNFIFRKR